MASEQDSELICSSLFIKWGPGNYLEKSPSGKATHLQKSKRDTAIIVIHRLHRYHNAVRALLAEKRPWQYVLYLPDLPKTLPEEEEGGFRMTPSTIDQTFNLRNWTENTENMK